MTKSVLIVAPEARPGQPVTERVRSFVDFFQRKGIHCRIYPAPTSFRGLLALVKVIYAERYRNVFVTMPPFRNWSLCFLPGVNVILDIRDGWSIAMQTGYGGTSKPAKAKAWVARCIEQMAIRCSGLTITCTPGLVRYHATKWNRQKLLFIPNGFPSDKFEMVAELRRQAAMENPPSNELVFICAGKFSEYGVEAAKRLIRKIAKDHKDSKCKLVIYGSDFSSNKWVNEFILSDDTRNVSVELKERIEQVDLIKNMVLADYGIAIIRDEDYDFGTKIFDYLVSGLKVFDCFDPGKSFHKYFREYFHSSASIEDSRKFIREGILQKNGKFLLDKIV